MSENKNPVRLEMSRLIGYVEALANDYHEKNGISSSLISWNEDNFMFIHQNNALLLTFNNGHYPTGIGYNISIKLYSGKFKEDGSPDVFFEPKPLFLATYRLFDSDGNWRKTNIANFSDGTEDKSEEEIYFKELAFLWFNKLKVLPIRKPS